MNLKHLLIPVNRLISVNLLIPVLFIGCRNLPVKEEKVAVTVPNPLFTLLPPGKTNITFSNPLTESLNTNVLMYEYFYNGGGVAAGDLNGDGLDDLYFTGNMTSNHLYLNKGNLQFENITHEAGVAGREGPWKTGVTMVDINADGLLDIYVCYSGNVRPERRTNQLFINKGANAKGIPVFSEEAKKYGLDVPSATTHAVFFDYDRDNDLDAFLLNHNTQSLPVLNEVNTAEMLKKDDNISGVRLFRNTNGSFHDVTTRSGISSSALTYGLGAGVADINQDGWPDLYISNDYTVPDYLYFNNKNGTFTDELQKRLGHTSHFSMGNDIADINNDALPDIITLDMLPEDNRRQKLLFAPDNYGKFDLNLRVGFYYQYMRNMLHINNGNGTFRETGQMYGISNTDWSWAPLFADYDNDGWKDLFVTNGYVRDYTNMDFIKYMDSYIQQKGRLKREDVLALIHKMPASNVVNYLYKNENGNTFNNVTTAWGFDHPANSNGAVYTDLDNDGDLDMVVSNVNHPAFIYRNESDKQLKHHYLKVKLEGAGNNTAGLGAKVMIFSKGKRQYQEQMPARGYQSSVSPVMHIGLGDETSVDSLLVIWPDGKSQLLQNVKADQLLVLDQKKASGSYSFPKPSPSIFEEVKSPVVFQHQKNIINDFKRQPLLVNPLSFGGPCLAKGDVNNDGLEDVYAGGGEGQPGMLFVQQKNGSFLSKNQPAFEQDKMSDDTDAVFFDANNDSFPDLYVCSGGYHSYTPDDVLLQDRLYLNDSKGNFIRSKDALPEMRVSKSCVRVADINNDHYPDLFVGGRVIPGRYPEAPRSYLLVNDGKGHFTDATASRAPALQNIGMVSDAAWADLNKDGGNDLVVVGEWMPVTVFVSTNGTFADKTDDYFDKKYRGWWNKLLTGDFNHDGRTDLVVGNLGLNSQCKATDTEPVEMYYSDVDNNGSVDPILCFYIQGKSYPYVSRDELLEQLGMMRQRFTDYKNYADATLENIFKEEERKKLNHLEANYLKTAYFESSASGKFLAKDLPLPVQASPVYTILPLDYNDDGKDDLLLCGNINHARLRFGKYDANDGQLLKGDGKGNFVYVPQPQSGFNVWGDVRCAIKVNNSILLGINQGAVKAYRKREKIIALSK